MANTSGAYRGTWRRGAYTKRSVTPRTWPELASPASAYRRLDDRLAVSDHDVELDLAIFVLFAELGFSGADRFGHAFERDLGFVGLLLGLLQPRVQLAQTRVVDGGASGSGWLCRRRRRGLRGCGRGLWRGRCGGRRR